MRLVGRELITAELVRQIDVVCRVSQNSGLVSNQCPCRNGNPPCPAPEAYLRGADIGSRSRTPGPPPFSSMNSTPAASKACRIASSLAAVSEVS
jgi:hypothetical protein